MADDPGLFDIMYSMRAMRRLKPDPVPDELIQKVIEAGTRAPSGGNQQVWSFIVVKDAAKKKFIQERYHAAFSKYFEARMAAAQRNAEAGGAPPDEATMRMANAAFYLAEHMHEAPVLLFACTPYGEPPQTDLEKELASGSNVEGASIYPAVQNMLLACRALGLGTVLTTLHKVHEDEIRAELGVPDNIDLAALLPIGYPMGNFGPVSRTDPKTLTHWDAWGATKA